MWTTSKVPSDAAAPRSRKPCVTSRPSPPRGATACDAGPCPRPSRPAGSGAVLQKQAGSRPEVQQRPAAAAVEQPLEGVEALRVDQIEPLAILEVTLDVERFLRRVVLVAVDVLEFRRRRDRNDV